MEPNFKANDTSYDYDCTKTLLPRGVNLQVFIKVYAYCMQTISKSIEKEKQKSENNNLLPWNTISLALFPSFDYFFPSNGEIIPIFCFAFKFLTVPFSAPYKDINFNRRVRLII